MNWRLLSFVIACVTFGFAINSVDASAATDNVSGVNTWVDSGVDSVLTLAQYNSDDSSSGGSTRVRSRGMGKLIGLAIAGIIALGSFVMKMFRGNNE
jgi:hypothetical protein